MTDNIKAEWTGGPQRPSVQNATGWPQKATLTHATDKRETDMNSDETPTIGRLLAQASGHSIHDVGHRHAAMVQQLFNDILRLLAIQFLSTVDELGEIETHQNTLSIGVVLHKSLLAFLILHNIVLNQDDQ